MQYTNKFANRVEYLKPSAIRLITEKIARPGITSFAGGLPDPNLFPAEKLRLILDEILTNNSKAALQYCLTAGITPLREKIAARMQAEGMDCGLDNIMIIQGGQQGMDFMARLFLNKGDVVVTERPTFLGSLLNFNPMEIEYKCCGMDQDGMRMDELEEVLKTTPRVKFIYTISDFQNPMGVTLSLERRKKMLELASRYDVMILEDSPYREIRYDGETVPSIKSLDSEGRVVFVGTFSKTLCPGLRLGWTVASPEITAKMILLKQASDTQCSSLNQYLVNRFMELYSLDEHVAGLRSAYKRKKDVMLKTLGESFPASASWTNAEGGLFIWLTVRPDLDTEKVLMERLLDEAKAAYVPGAAFFPVRPEHNHARLNFSEMSEQTIVDGISKMGAVFRDIG